MLLLLVSPSLAAAPGRETKFEKMLTPRTATCWVEGMVLDELVIGSRARLTFVCVDRRLGGEIFRLRPDNAREEEYESVPAWLRESAGGYMKHRDKTLFAVLFTTAKPWDFDLTKIRVGDRRLSRGDVEFGGGLRQVVPADESVVPLPSDFTGQLVFFVPSDSLKPGSEIEIGYDESFTRWSVPKN